MFRSTPVTAREWGLFGLRWVLPAALLVFMLSASGAGERPPATPALVIGVGMLVLNLVVALLLLGEVWRAGFLMPLLVIDTAASLAAAYLIDPRLGWAGLLPVALTGLYFGWAAGMLHGVLTGAVLAGIHLLVRGPLGLVDPAALAVLGGFLAAGPLAYLLSRGDWRDEEARAQQLASEQQAQEAARHATEVMAVVYDMAEVLTASKLDPHRVLNSAVNFGLEGLERVGVEPPLFAAILLFAVDEASAETVLRVAETSRTVASSDREVTALGIGGAIHRALSQFQPIVSHAPDVDPELRYFDSFRSCQTVLCLPLKSGPDSYGVMVVGSQEPDAFEDLHVELMWVIANQAAASLNNAKLYVSLLRQRDRLVEVEKAARAQLAANLHDGPTQGLSAVTMRLNYIRRLLDKKPEAAVDELYKIEDLARRTTKEVRMMLFELRPKSLDHGLSAGLDQLAKKMLETYSQNIEVQIAEGVDAILDTQSTTTLFSIVTEALHNARKHARADLIRIVAGVQADELMLVIEDNGRGFDVDEALAAANQREGHLGLNNLYDRAALVEGTLSIESTPGQGSRISVVVPLEALRLRRAEEMTRQADGTAPEMFAGYPV